MTEQQIMVTNAAYTALSAVSLCAGLLSAILNRYFYHCNKHKYPHMDQSQMMEGIFFLTLSVICLFELFESFQWFVLLHDFVGCKVLGGLREYTIMCVLVAIVCLAVHMLILLTGPKCFNVIIEEKRRRYKILLASYVIATFALPVFFIPWAFINIRYGKGEYICWLEHIDSCVASDDDVSADMLDRLLMWYVWAILVWLFAVVVTALAMLRYCFHAAPFNGTKSKCDRNVAAIISMLAVFIASVVANGVLFTWELVTGKSSFAIAISSAVITPLMCMAYVVVVGIRHVSIIKGGLRNASRRHGCPLLPVT